MRLEDAEGIVMGWLDPLREPRVEAAYYLTEGSLREGGVTSAYDVFAPFQTEMDFGDGFPIANSTRNLVLVRASTLGMDTAYRANPNYGPGPGFCLPVAANQRQELIAIFDAATGMRIGAGPVRDDQYRDLLDSLAERGRPVIRELAALVLPTSTATETPPPTTTALPLPDFPTDFPVPERLGAGEVPEALAKVVRELPIVDGSKWTYEVAGYQDGVFWSRHTYQIKVDAAWALGQAAMVARIDQEGSGGFVVVLPTGVINLPLCTLCEPAALSNDAISAIRDALHGRPLPTPEMDRMRLSLLRVPIVLPSQYDDAIAIRHRESVTVPVGHFADCAVISEIISAGSQHTSWLCPGVGIVKRDMPACSTMFGGYGMVLLIDYFIPPIVAVHGTS